MFYKRIVYRRLGFYVEQMSSVNILDHCHVRSGLENQEVGPTSNFFGCVHQYLEIHSLISRNLLGYLLIQFEPGRPI